MGASTPEPPRFDHLRLGRYGEDLAARWYRARGWALLARNWRTGTGEIDLILACGRDLVICEVKTRSTRSFGSPAEAVGVRKQMRLRRLAAEWIATEAPFRPASVRFDVAEVVGGRIEVIEGAW